MISPSALELPTSSPFTCTLSRISRARPPLWTVTSLSAAGSGDGSPPRAATIAAWRVRRRSVTYFPEARRSRASHAWSLVAAVRNPTRPRLTPSTGTWAPSSIRAPRSRVPSPPRVIRASSGAEPIGGRWEGQYGSSAGSGRRGRPRVSPRRAHPRRGRGGGGAARGRAAADGRASPARAPAGRGAPGRGSPRARPSPAGSPRARRSAGSRRPRRSSRFEALLVMEGDDPGRDPRPGEAEALQLLGAGRLVDEPVGHSDAVDPHLGVGRLELAREHGAEPVDHRALLHRDDQLALVDHRLEQDLVVRLEEPAVDDRGLEARGGEAARGVERRLDHGPHGEI